MKGMLVVALVALFAIWAFQASKAFESVPYTAREGIVKVQKVRFEWHPERLTPFLKQLPEKAGQFLKRHMTRFRREEAAQPDLPETALQATSNPIRLKNGTVIQGRIVEEKEGLVWIEMEGGKVAFDRKEIASP